MAKSPTQAELDNLVKLYRGAREKLLDTIINYSGVGTKTYANTILQQVQAQLIELGEQSKKYAETEIPREYQDNLNDVYRYFQRNHLQMRPPALFARIHTDAINVIAHEMQYQIEQGIAQVGRQIRRYVDSAQDNVLRMAGLQATGEKFASGSTVLQMKNDLVRRLQDEGFMTVQYGSGKNAYQVPIDVYAQMVARSTTREAGNTARFNQLTENGYDLVTITAHTPTCSICAQYENRVYSISGRDKRFPKLSVAIGEQYANIHPNCRHVFVPWIEELQTEEEIAQAIKSSNRPYEDTRSKQEVERYKEQQAKGRQIRRDRYQYERYKAVLGEDAPKSFRTFHQMKKTDGDKWRFTQLDYKRRCKLLDHPELALPYVDTALADDRKFTHYFFGGTHPGGLSKGVAFNSRLGYNISNWEELQAQLIERAKYYPATFKRSDKFGNHYEQKMVIYGKKGKPANVIAAWTADKGHTHLSTAYIERVK
jgi:hypothetical protein